MAETLSKTETTTVLVDDTEPTTVTIAETKTTEIRFDESALLHFQSAAQATEPWLTTPSAEPDFVFADDGERPMVRDYGKVKPKFMLGDQVRLVVGRGRTEGPFLVESFDKKTLTYKLCDARGKSAKAGKAFGEKELVLDDPFA